jgi:hypothetical protein
MQVRTTDGGWIGYAVTFGIVAIVFALRWRRMSRVTPLRVERLWIFPAVYAAMATWLYVEFPPQGLAWLFCAAALALGAALGWQRGRLMRITVDPDTHRLNQSGSPAALLFLLALVLVRSAARALLAQGGGPLHLNAMAVTDILLALGLGLFATQRLEMYLRARRLLAAARG